METIASILKYVQDVMLVSILAKLAKDAIVEYTRKTR